MSNNPYSPCNFNSCYNYIMDKKYISVSMKDIFNDFYMYNGSVVIDNDGYPIYFIFANPYLYKVNSKSGTELTIPSFYVYYFDNINNKIKPVSVSS